MNDLTLPVPSGALDRRTYIGGSDVAAIMGLSPWRTPLQCYDAKISNDPEQITEEKRKFFARRKRQEPVIAEMLADEGIEVTCLSLDDNPNRYTDAAMPFLAAEIDFEFAMNDAVRDRFADREEFAAIPNGTICNGEIKTVHPFSASEWGEQGSEDVPIHYAAQVMHGLGVTRRPAAIAAALFGLDNLLLFPIMPDADTITGMREKCRSFWFDNVMPRVPPDPSNMEDMMRLFSKVNGKPVKTTPTLTENLYNLKRIRSSMSAFKRDDEAVKFSIAQEIYAQWGLIDPDENKVDNAIIQDGSVVLATWERQSATRIDASLLRIKYPDVASQVSKQSHTRVLRFPKPKKGA